MFTIVFVEEAPAAVRGLGFHTGSYRDLVSISPELVAMGCPNDADKALTWAAMSHNLTLVSRTQTRMISRTQREMTLTLKGA